MQAIWQERLEAVEDAEVHWSTGTILATFFAASLISAVFFGLGYSFGRGGTAKPVKGAVSHAVVPSVGAIGHSANSSVVAAMRPVDNNATQIHAASQKSFSAPAVRVAVPPAKRNKPVTPPAPARSQVAKGPVAVSHYMVQVSAVVHRSDAQTLVSQLRKRGFHARIYPGTHDKYLHVQIGPFATSKQAEAMRHQVMASGYRAILKHVS